MVDQSRYYPLTTKAMVDMINHLNEAEEALNKKAIPYTCEDIGRDSSADVRRIDFTMANDDSSQDTIKIIFINQNASILEARGIAINADDVGDEEIGSLIFRAISGKLLIKRRGILKKRRLY